MRVDPTQFHRNRAQRVQREHDERHHCPGCGANWTHSIYDDGVYECRHCGAEWALRTPNDLPVDEEGW